MKNNLFGRFVLLCTTTLVVFCSSPKDAKSAAAISKARGNANALRQIRTLYIRDWRGDPTFKRNLQREMRAMGFVFTSNRNRAQAFVDARGGGNNGDFLGELWISDRSGKTLWRERAYRPRGSNSMAYLRLAGKLRAALKR